jgi:predicted RecB family endonuclease
MNLLSDQKELPSNLTINVHAPVNSFNFGTIIGSINQSLKDIPQEDVKSALTKLRDVISHSNQSDEWQNEMLENLDFLADQAKTSSQKTKPVAVQAVIDKLKSGLGVVADVVTVLPLLKTIGACLGVTLT